MKALRKEDDIEELIKKMKKLARLKQKERS